MLVVAWFAAFFALSVLQYETAHSRSFDLALYARSLWGIAYGEPINPLRDQHFLALHGHFVLYALAPLARIMSSVYLLLALQSLAIAAGAVVTYAIAARRLESKSVAFAVAVMYLAYPIASNTVLFDMHVKTLATPFLLVAIDRFDRLGAGDGAAWLSLVVALACREEIGLAVGVMGVAWLVFPEKRRAGAALAAIGFVVFCVYYFGVQPKLGTDAASTQAHFGHLRDGGWWAQLATKQNLVFVGFLLGSLAFLPVLGWRFSIGASVPVGLAMLSRWPDTAHPTSHYAFLAMPFLILGAVEGLALVRDRAPTTLRWAVVAGVLCSLISYRAVGLGPGGAEFNRERYAFTPTAIDATRCLASIPDDVPALAPDHLVAHIAERTIVTTSLRSPTQANQLRSALLDVDALAWMSGAPGYAGYLTSRRAAADHLRTHFDFTQAKRCGPYLLLTRD